jgi:hypothetical protein
MNNHPHGRAADVNTLFKARKEDTHANRGGG